ncbi:proline-rich protein PRCC isoform X2 [Synchiropus splendidus]|uniref:proline-rich protein PRCC isoform X2 n=1 Tax=Synchiropus splendidus TaxID=270530 RepID=UPI00237E2D22|nr:proline-rich protein PRCC isoform X2 [Synchiropus splendidus]
MSLVAYGSSDESDSEETSTHVPESTRGTGGLFSRLPAPKKTIQIRQEEVPGKQVAGSRTDDAQNFRGDLFSSLPKPKKRTEPVKITAPQIHRRDSDSDDDEPAKKKVQPKDGGSGLASLLPKPKNLTVKEMDRILIPHTLTKRPEAKAVKSSTPATSSLASPSAIKAAAKSAALQLARQIAADDQEEDITPQNYFSFGETERVVPSVEPEPAAPAESFVMPTVNQPGQSDAPLDFGGGQEAAGAWGGQYATYQSAGADPESFAQGYYNEQYYEAANAGGSEEVEEPGQAEMFDDEAFMRMQGKRNRGKEEIKFLEIKGDDQLSGTKQWLTKNLTEETQQSYSKKRGGQPTGQQRRKHQITYLIHQAKERELELKNTWAENKLTRRQTQAKYGF